MWIQDVQENKLHICIVWTDFFYIVQAKMWIKIYIFLTGAEFKKKKKKSDTV